MYNTGYNEMSQKLFDDWQYICYTAVEDYEVDDRV